MSTDELYMPLVVDKTRYDPIKEETYYQRLFVDIDENRLYFRDFWDRTSADRIDQVRDESEYSLAKKCKSHMIKDKKYRKRFFREKADLTVIGRQRSNCRQEIPLHKWSDFHSAGFHKVFHWHAEDKSIFQANERLHIFAVFLQRS